MTAILRARVVATPFYGSPGLKLIAENEGPSLALLLIVAGFKDGDMVTVTNGDLHRELQLAQAENRALKGRTIDREFAAAHCIDDPSRPE